jgi:hypothetical protein
MTMFHTNNGGALKRVINQTNIKSDPATFLKVTRVGETGNVKLNFEIITNGFEFELNNDVEKIPDNNIFIRDTDGTGNLLKAEPEILISASDDVEVLLHIRLSITAVKKDHAKFSREIK